MSPREHLMASAERELGAFMGAVSEVFGAEHARRAADDWLDEFERMDTLPEIGSHFLSVTIAAAVRLATSLNANRILVIVCRIRRRIRLRSLSANSIGRVDMKRCSVSQRASPMTA